MDIPSSPSRGCARGIHLASRINPGAYKCQWCGKVLPHTAAIMFRSVYRSSEVALIDETAQSTAPSLASVPAATEDSTLSVGCCGSATRQATYHRPTITEVHEQ